MRKHFNLLKATILTLFIVVSISAKAQFVYGGVDLTYNNLVFNSNDVYDNTSLNDMRLHLNGTYRFLRRVGIGAQVDIPIISSFKYAFIGNTNRGGNEYNFSSEEDSYSFGGTVPTEVGYDIKNTSTISIYPRLYIGSTSGIYIDLRYNLMNLQEEFSYSRQAYSGEGNLADLDPKTQSFNKDHSVSGYGLRIGYFNQFSNHFYYEYSLVIDVYNFDDVNSFKYEIPYSSFQGEYDSVNLNSMITGTRISWQIAYGVGYYF